MNNIFSNIFKFHDFKISVPNLIVLGIIMVICIFYLDLFLPEFIIKKIHNFSEKCVLKCTDEDTCNKFNKFRDSGYYLFDTDNGKCIVTRWEISHFITHAILGYLTNIYVSVPVSIGFEIYEHYKYDCGSYLDLVYNFSGFLTGYYLRHSLLFKT